MTKPSTSGGFARTPTTSDSDYSSATSDERDVVVLSAELEAGTYAVLLKEMTVSMKRVYVDVESTERVRGFVRRSAFSRPVLERDGTFQMDSDMSEQCLSVSCHLYCYCVVG